MRKFLQNHHPLPSSNRPKPAYNSGQKFKNEPGKVNNKKRSALPSFITTDLFDKKKRLNMGVILCYTLDNCPGSSPLRNIFLGKISFLSKKKYIHLNIYGLSFLIQ